MYKDGNNKVKVFLRLKCFHKPEAGPVVVLLMVSSESMRLGRHPYRICFQASCIAALLETNFGGGVLL